MTDWEEITDLFRTASGKEETEKLLNELLSSKEKNNLTERWQIAKELFRGKPQRKIAREHKISLSKVTAVSKALQNKQSIIYRVLSAAFDETHL